MIKERNFEYENSLVLSVQKGEEQAFEDLYKLYYKKIYHICNEYFHDTMRAEDITQEVFIKVYKNISKLSSQEAFNVWIIRIAYNCCHSYYKKTSRDATGNTVDLLDEDNESCFENIVNDTLSNNQGMMLEFARAKDIIIKTLEDMKSENRVVGYLYFFEQLSYKEIVDITGEPRGTIASRIKRIKVTLSDVLEKHNISKNSCFSILLLPNMVRIYQDYINAQQVPIQEGGVTTIMQKSKVTPKVKNLPYVLIIILSVVIPVTMLMQQSSSLQGTAIHAEIEKIQYNKQLTNKPLSIQVKLSKGAYDKVLLDGNKELSVKENGTHILELYYDEKVIDRKQFDINNIDMNAPSVKKVETATSIELHIKDEHGIAYDDIKMFNNGAETKEFELDRKTNIITVNKGVENKAFISIVDIVGNKVDVNVRFYEVYK